MRTHIDHSTCGWTKLYWTAVIAVVFAVLLSAAFAWQADAEIHPATTAPVDTVKWIPGPHNGEVSSVWIKVTDDDRLLSDLPMLIG